MTKLQQEKQTLQELDDAMNRLDDTRREIQSLALDVMQFNPRLARHLVDVTNTLMIVDSKYNMEIVRK